MFAALGICQEAAFSNGTGGVSKVRWDEVQERFPNEWVVFEANKAYSKEGQCFIEEMSVIDSYVDSTKALKRYSELHQEAPHREYCFFTLPVLRLWRENDMWGSEGQDEYNRNL